VILIDSTSIIGLFPQLLGPGGVQEAGRITAAALREIAARRDWLTTFLSLNDSPGEHALETIEAPDAIDRRISFEGFDRTKGRFTAAAILRARRASRSGRVILLATHPNLALPSSLAQQLSGQCKSIVMTHGVEVWKPLLSLRRRALLRANLVFAPSRYTAQKLNQIQRVPAAKIRRLPWPLNPAFLRMSDSPDSLPLPADFPRGRVVLTVGRWSYSERYKGTDDLIQAIGRLRTTVPDLHLVAVGDGDDLPRLKAIAQEHGVADRVHFLTNCTREELGACYHRAEIFALPSTGEGFGLVFLEAMAFSKAVIGAAFGGALDLIEHEKTGILVAPHEVNQLAEALRRLLHDDSLRQKMGRRGGKVARQQFSFSAFQKQLEEILDALWQSGHEVDLSAADWTVPGARAQSSCES
jgi:phosphatidyl-myo-inositol dimannoside synthase